MRMESINSEPKKGEGIKAEEVSMDDLSPEDREAIEALKVAQTTHEAQVEAQAKKDKELKDATALEDAARTERG